MKAKIALLVFFMSCLICAQQTSFIIGADWLNSIKDQPLPMTDAYWGLMEELNLNFGSLILSYQKYTTQDIKNELDRAASHHIKIELNTYNFPEVQHLPGTQNHAGINTEASRRMYQIEGDYDFSSHATGKAAYTAGAEYHWSRFKKNVIGEPNYWDLENWRDNAGIVAKGWTEQNALLPDNDYYVKIKAKKINDGRIDNPPVLSVSLIDKANSNIIYSKTLNYNEMPEAWSEIPLFNFTQGISPTQQIDSSLMNLDDFYNRCHRTLVNNLNTYELQIEWTGTVSCQLDYIVFDDSAGDKLFNGDYNTSITTGADEYAVKPALLFYKLWDEPDYNNYLPIRYANNLVLDHFNNQPGINTLAFNCGQEPYQFLAQTQLSTQRCDFVFLFNPNDVQHRPIVPPPSTDPDYLFKFQQAMEYQNKLLDSEITYSKFLGGNFWYAPTHSEWSTYLREASAYETKLMANLGIAYGAKGIQYLYYSVLPKDTNGIDLGKGFLDNDNYTSPVKRIKDDFGYDKWDIIKALNAKIASQGSMLMSLTWNSSYYIPDNQLSGKYITNVQYYIPDEQSSVNFDGTPYIQLSFFDDFTLADHNKERFYLINRRTMPDDQRNINITYDKTSTNPNNLKNWTIREVSTNNYWSGGVIGSFYTSYDPAEGKLFTLEPTVLNGGDLHNNETISGNYTLTGGLTIKSGVNLIVTGTYNISANITVESGGSFTINPGATLNLQNGASLTVNGTLNLGTNTQLNLASGDSLFAYGHLICGSDLNILSGSTLVLHHWSILDLENVTLTIEGTLTSGFETGTSTINGGSIIFEGAGSSGSVLKNVNWNNGMCLLCELDANVTISGCSFNYPADEINIYKASPKIIQNTIYEPMTSGIMCNQAGSWDSELLIWGNQIYKSSNNSSYQSYEGIWSYGSVTYLSQNIVNGFYFGVLMDGGSVSMFNNPPDMTPYPNNLITDNVYGLTAQSSSMVLAGCDVDEIGMYNSIHDNTNLDLGCYTNSYTEAGFNYWFPTMGYYSDPTSEIYEIDYFLGTDPWGDQNLATVRKPNNTESFKHLNKSTGSDSSSNLSMGLLLEKQGRISDAILFYKNLILKNKYIQIAVRELTKIEMKYNRNEISGYLEGLLTDKNYYTVVEKIFGDNFLKNNQFDSAIVAYNNVIKNTTASY
ncbi:MAG: hypothetical protein P4L35_05050, partial [Ignavibacteriaceae bacterium]|nr:hypothetical protein [Ignavibacteriaceae bacterium]